MSNKFNLAQKAYLMGVGLDAADPEILNGLGDTAPSANSDSGDKFPDIKDWDGVYRDLDQCGVDTGYQPGTPGAKAWEALHPGQKVVDWLNRDENDPEYAPDEGSASGEDSNDSIGGDFLSQYKAAVDAINREAMQKFSLQTRPFNYDLSDNLNESNDPDDRIFETYIKPLHRLYESAERDYVAQSAGKPSVPFFEVTRRMSLPQQ